MDYRTMFMMESLTLFTLSSFLVILISFECHGAEEFKREEIEPIVRGQVRDAMKIKNVADRENTIVNLILTETQKFYLANQKVGILIGQKDVLSIPMQKLKLRSAIESIVKDHYPGTPKRGYMEAFHEMFTSNAVRFTEKKDLMVFRKMIEDSKLSIERFIQMVKELYSKLSDQAAHNLEGYDIVKLPKVSDDVEKITKLLECIVLPVDQDHILAVQLILKSHPVTPKTKTIPLEDLCCIRIEAQSEGEEKTLQRIKASIRDEDVHSIFPRSKPKKIEHKDLNENSPKDLQRVIMVHFDDVKEAKKALEFSQRFLKEVLITLKLVSCNDELSTTTAGSG